MHGDCLEDLNGVVRIGADESDFATDVSLDVSIGILLLVDSPLNTCGAVLVPTTRVGGISKFFVVDALRAASRTVLAKTQVVSADEPRMVSDTIRLSI